VLILSRKQGGRILVNRDGKDLWLTVTKIGVDVNNQPFVKLGFNADSPLDFTITRSELIEEANEREVEALAAELLS
jgi:sRNA-binding carbon storage regulator CsrA